jgi:hypothetical protein
VPPCGDATEGVDGEPVLSLDMRSFALFLASIVTCGLLLAGCPGDSGTSPDAPVALDARPAVDAPAAPDAPALTDAPEALDTNASIDAPSALDAPTTPSDAPVPSDAPARDARGIPPGQCEETSPLCAVLCLVTVSCVTECGGPITECGCCPCAAGSISAATCGSTP